MEQELIQKGTLLKFDPKSSFTILSKGHVVNLHFSEITHVSKHGNETVIHTPTHRWRTYHSLQEILNDLPVNDFFRVHKSQVVAFKFIEGYSKENIIINGHCVPMTNYYRLQLSKQLGKILNQGYKMFIHEPTGRTVITGNAGGYGALPEKRSGPAL